MIKEFQKLSNNDKVKLLKKMIFHEKKLTISQWNLVEHWLKHLLEWEEKENKEITFIL